jgi:Kef-type K+ transport system membrane component KefB
VAADAAGWVDDPLFLAVTLGATSLGIVAPLLKDTGNASRPLGRYVLAGATVADFATILLLSIVFAGEGGGAAGRLVPLAGFVLAVTVAAVVLMRIGRNDRVDAVLVRLQDTTAAIRVRIAVALLLGFVALAASVGLETILGAFVAGAILVLVDRESMSHPHFRLKLESIGYGFVVPIFFVTSGLRFDLGSLTDQPAALVRVPVLLAALLAVRGIPAILYRRAVGSDGVVTSALLQATSLPFIVTATQIGVSIDAVTPATAAALVAAGLVSTVAFPSIALARLERSPAAVTPPPSTSLSHREITT